MAGGFSALAADAVASRDDVFARARWRVEERQLSRFDNVALAIPPAPAAAWPLPPRGGAATRRVDPTNQQRGAADGAAEAAAALGVVFGLGLGP